MNFFQFEAGRLEKYWKLIILLLQVLKRGSWSHFVNTWRLICPFSAASWCLWSLANKRICWLTDPESFIKQAPGLKFSMFKCNCANGLLIHLNNQKNPLAVTFWSSNSSRPCNKLRQRSFQITFVAKNWQKTCSSHFFAKSWNLLKCVIFCNDKKLGPRKFCKSLC